MNKVIKNNNNYYYYVLHRLRKWIDFFQPIAKPNQTRIIFDTPLKATRLA